MPVGQVKRNQITNAGLEPLTGWLELRSLDIHGTKVTDRGLQDYLAAMPRLQRLSLAYLNIGDAGIESLDTLVWLDRLNLKSTFITNAGITRLANERAHTLKNINLSNTALKDKALEAFPTDSQIQQLRVTDTAITDVGVAHVSRFPWLHTLDLGLTDVTDDGTRFLADSHHLRVLDLSSTNVTDTTLVWLSDTSIQQLKLGGTKVTDAGMPAVADLESLSSLDLAGTVITERGLRFLSEATSLERLFIEHTQVGSGSLEPLRELPLQSLMISREVSDNGVASLGGLEELRHLAVYDTKANSWGPLTQLEKLEILLVDDSVGDLSALKEMTSLRHLLLAGEQFAPTEVARLRPALPRCQIDVIPWKQRPDLLFRSLLPHLF